MELFALVLTLAGIARMARTRGASPSVYAGLAGGGWLLIRVLTPRVLALLACGISNPAPRCSS